MTKAEKKALANYWWKYVQEARSLKEVGCDEAAEYSDTKAVQACAIAYDVFHFDVSDYVD